MTTTIVEAIDAAVRAQISAEREAAAEGAEAQSRDGMTLVEIRTLQQWEARHPWARGVTPAQVAKRIGEAIGSWRRYVITGRSPSLAKVEWWAKAAGLVLVWRADEGWECGPTGSPNVDLDGWAQRMRERFESGDLVVRYEMQKMIAEWEAT